jgi:hypothetical protein
MDSEFFMEQENRNIAIITTNGNFIKTLFTGMKKLSTGCDSYTQNA